MILPGTELSAAKARVEVLRAQVSSLAVRMPDGRELQVTCSAGVAELPSDGLDAATLLARADRRLLEAKRAGRNRVHAHDAPDGRFSFAGSDARPSERAASEFGNV